MSCQFPFTLPIYQMLWCKEGWVASFNMGTLKRFRTPTSQSVRMCIFPRRPSNHNWKYYSCTGQYPQSPIVIWSILQSSVFHLCSIYFPPIFHLFSIITTEFSTCGFPEIGGTPIHHPFPDGIFPCKPSSYKGVPPLMETPRSSVRSRGRASNSRRRLNLCRFQPPWRCDFPAHPAWLLLAMSFLPMFFGANGLHNPSISIMWNC